MSEVVYPTCSRAKLHVISVISNTARYNSRPRLYKQFAPEMTKNPLVEFWTVELAFGDRPHEVTEMGNPRHIQLRTDQEFWHKENMINIAISRLPRDWEYVAWIDADIKFLRDDWAYETIQALQHHAIVQPWSHVVDLGPNKEMVHSAKSFAWYYYHDMPHGDPQKYGYWHSGYAWAARRDAIDALGGLIDWAILGSADFYMAWAMVGRLSKNLYNDVHNLELCKKGFTQAYVDSLFQWQERASVLQGNVGFVPGTIEHEWHGSKKKRGYNTREAILINGEYNPHTDLQRDWQGLWRMVTKLPRQLLMAKQIHKYFRSRNEDSIDLD